MNYNQAIDFIYSRRKFEKSSGHERIAALLDALDRPQLSLKFVHVVGTNGKGTVSTMISEGAKAAGIKTGLFTSPYVVDFCERIQVNNEYIGHDELADIISDVKAACEEIENDGLFPTFFEVVLAAALLYFKKCDCSLAVLEAGIGGGNDSTNIIPSPAVTVITAISLDHTEVLGNTAEKIAREKCGVIKKGSSVVSFPYENCGFDFVPQPEEAVKVIKEVCREKECELSFPDMNELCLLDDREFRLGSVKAKISFSGDHQLANAAVSILSLQKLRSHGFAISDEAIEKGLKNAFLPARMEKISNNPTVIIDGGHNVGCIKALIKMLEKDYPEKSITAVLGFMKDKDYESCIRLFAPLCKNIVFTLADPVRGEKSQTLLRCAEGLCENLFAVDNIEEAFKIALSLSDGGVTVCAGSFYLVSEIRKILRP
ncbi:MAG: bifunctional folylpolyglutamate synthase/dihydrofolate synthase [Acutalibacteraceae bacterium]